MTGFSQKDTNLVRLQTEKAINEIMFLEGIQQQIDNNAINLLTFTFIFNWILYFIGILTLILLNGFYIYQCSTDRKGIYYHQSKIFVNLSD